MIRARSTPLRIASACVAFLATTAYADPGKMIVPGGTELAARLRHGVDPAPDRFAASYNDILLESVRNDESWELNPARAELVEYVRIFREITRDFRSPIELQPSDGKPPDALKRLAEVFGYSVGKDRAGFRVKPRAGEKHELRQRIGNKIGWSLGSLVDSLNRGEAQELHFETGEVRPLFDLESWSRICGTEVLPSNGLMQLAKDQRCGLVYAGLARISEQTAETLDGEAVRWIYFNAATAFFRYSAAIDIRDGRLTVPGDDEAIDGWSRIVGVSPEEPEAFVRALLTEHDAAWAHVWHALFFAPPELARGYTSALFTPSARSTLKAYSGRQIEIGGRAFFTRARRNGSGFGDVIAGVPVGAPGLEQALPGGNRLWLLASSQGGLPGSETQLDKLEQKALKEELAYDRFLAQLLTRKTVVEDRSAGLDRRVSLTLGLLATRPHLATPDNVATLNRVGARMPSALVPLRHLTIEDPGITRDYGLLVTRLSRLEPNANNHLLQLSFQGGVQLLSGLARNGRLPAPRLSEFLGEWLELHEAEKDPFRLAPRQSDWLARLVAGLPPMPEGFPGRDAWERTLVAALVPWPSSETFSWRGLDYQSSRGDVAAGRVVEILSGQRIPSAGQLIGLHETFHEIESACKAADLDAVHQAAQRGIDQLNALPEIDLGTPLPGSLKKQMGSNHRLQMTRVLETFLKQDKAKKLPKMTPRIDELRRKMTPELGAFLLSSAYIAPMAAMDSLAFRQPNLIRKHTAVNETFSEQKSRAVNDTPWASARVVPAQDAAIGAHLAGHLATVPDALLELHYDFLPVTKGPGAKNSIHGAWFRDKVASRWATLTPEVAGFVSAALDAGLELVEIASRPGAENEALGRWVRRVVPAARLEGTPAIVTPGDRVGVVLSLLDRGDDGERFLEQLSSRVRQRLLEATNSLGDGWRERLRAACSPTRAIEQPEPVWRGPWPPYEALEREHVPVALLEREWIDLRLAIVGYLGRHNLPGTLGADLADLIVASIPEELSPRTRWDWETVASWLAGLDEDYFDERMRECLKKGWYQLQGG